VLDFAWHYVKHGGIEPERMKVYEHNATRYTPVFEMMGVPMWRVAHLSDIPYVLNLQELGAGADNSAEQLELGKTMSKTVAKFANSGDPEHQGSEISTWPGAFYDVTKKELKEEFPRRLTLQLFGGPYGTKRVTVTDKEEEEASVNDAESAVRWEKLFSRCEFINSEKMREESGV
jgi:hypothetical protein